jgi:hypothetical protein
MSDSTQTDNIDILDAGSYRWQLKTHYRGDTDTHQIAVVAITSEHQHVHEGDGYSVAAKISGITATGGTGLYLLNNTNGQNPHLRAMQMTTTGAPASVELFEATVTALDGSQVTAYNKNRTSTNTPSLEIYTGPTLVTIGTKIDEDIIPAVGNKAGSAAEAVGEEWILKSSTKYCIRVTNNDNQDIDAMLKLFWYEETTQ